MDLASSSVSNVSETLSVSDSGLLIDKNFLDSVDAFSLYLATFAPEADEPRDSLVSTELLSWTESNVPE
ncbi:hypothetical protein OGAPHI_000391 [Ogataea philodendri]|uniref:Uncharacterized protein n=1 Tax=Ogataea philodendri TaxID=1378263 RepID=A0A9P8TAA5_9ASCO|nr:uncharacterized protein OGAPHI_000391 [Ogataea philodendri]KAH3671686.1 hypothetical protein OGAPHI_000391 [Ogataea philodendri]